MVKINLKKILALMLSATMMTGICNGEFYNDAYADDDVYTSTLPVQKVNNLPEDFFMGADISSAQSLYDAGVKYYNLDGEEEDMYEILADSGINYVRIRLWNDPYLSTASEKTVANSYGAGICDINYVKKMALAAQKAGLKVFLDFHYSDFWADPSKQKTPKAWNSYNSTQLNQAVYNFTYDSLVELKNAGVNNIGICQIGNETTGGVSGTSYNTTAYYNVFKNGCQAVRDFNAEYSTDIKNAIHFTDQTKFNYGTVASNFINNGVDFDIFGSSYYPEWGSHGTIESICSNLNRAKSVKNPNTGKNIDVMIAEVGYRYTGSATDDNGVYAKYGISMEGQAKFLRDVIAGVNEIGGIGVFYWEPAWVACGLDYNTYGTGWASDNAAEYEPNFTRGGECATTNLALFKKIGTKQIQAMESLNVFKYVYKGTSSAPINTEPVLGDNLVNNSSFEADYDNGASGNIRSISNWTLVSSSGDETDYPIYAENQNGYNGSTKLSVWTDIYDSYTVECYQEIDISNTGHGEYDISLYECGNVGNIYAYIKDGTYNSNGTVTKLSLGAVDSYTKYSGNAKVNSNDVITVGIKAENVSKNAWANIDCVEVKFIEGSGENQGDNPIDDPEEKVLSAPLVSLSESTEENTYIVNWNKVENATEYEVLIGNNTYAVTDDTSAKILAPYTGNNRINVIAKADGYEEAKSESVSVIVPDEILSAEIDNNGSLAWIFTNGGEADGFKIYQLLADGSYKEIDDIKATGKTNYVFNYQNKSVNTGLKETYKIVPYTQGNIVIYGKSKSVTVIEDSPKNDVTNNAPAKGETIKDKKYTYKVTKAGSDSDIGEVAITGLNKKSLVTIKIATKVTIGGITYKVTSIANNAFKNNNKIKKVFIGKNVKTIGKNAFAGDKKLKSVSINSKVLKTIGKAAFKNCKKLRKVIIKSAKITKIGKTAFKGIKKKATFKVPKIKKAKYKKMIKKSGAKNPKIK